MKSDFLKFAGITSLLMSAFAIAPYEAKAECSDKLLCMSYQQKFEEALKKTSKEDPLLIMDFRAYNAWEDLVKETQSLQETVSENFESYDNYRISYQQYKDASAVKVSDAQGNDPGEQNIAKSGVDQNLRDQGYSSSMDGYTAPAYSTEGNWRDRGGASSMDGYTAPAYSTEGNWRDRGGASSMDGYTAPSNLRDQGYSSSMDGMPTSNLNINIMQLDDSSFADLKLRGIMEDEYRLAATETGSDAIVSDSMEFSYSKVMDNYFRGIAKTDVRKIASHFINKFLKEPCQTADAQKNFEMRRLMLYRETLKEAAGLGYYAQVQSLDWAELLDDLEDDIKKYGTGDSSDINKVVRVNYVLRQFLNRLFTVLVQVRASQLELISVKRMFEDKVILKKKTMEYAKELAEEVTASNGEEG